MDENDRGSTPRPDPTIRTNEALFREITSMREIARSWVDSLQVLLESRLTSMDKAIKLHAEAFDRIPNLVDQKIANLQNLLMSEINGRVEVLITRLNGNDTALAAALQAAEKAVTKQNDSFAIATKKSEDAIFKQIDQLAALINTANKGLEDKIIDVRDRMTRFEGTNQGNAQSRANTQIDVSGHREDNRNMIAAVGVVAAMVFGFLGFLFGHSK